MCTLHNYADLSVVVAGFPKKSLIQNLKKKVWAILSFIKYKQSNFIEKILFVKAIKNSKIRSTVITRKLWNRKTTFRIKVLV